MSLASWFLAKVTFVTFFVLAISALANSVEYSGIITKSVIGEDGNPRGIQAVYTFHLDISDDRYRIELAAINDLSCFEQTVGSDGQDCYFEQKIWQSWKDKESNASYQESAEVTPGLFPTFASPEIQLVWILVASHRSLTNGEPIVLSHISYAPYDKLKAQIKYTEGADWPKSVEMLSPGTVLIDGKEYPLSPPFDKGYKLWDLSLNEAGETNGFVFPANATFFQYTVLTNLVLKQMESRKIRGIEIAITNVSENTQSLSDYLPVLSRTNLMVLDFRFSPYIPMPNMKAVDAIQYRLRDVKWLDRTNSRIKSIGMSVKLTSGQSIQTVSAGKRFAIIVSFISISFLFVIFLRQGKCG